LLTSPRDKVLTPLRVGDHVETYFDTGAFGCTLLYGTVVAAGPKTYTVEWESTARNRIRQGDWRVQKRREP
jgi:hypothetical protein